MKSRPVYALALGMLLGSASVWSQESKDDSNPAQARLPQTMRDVGNPGFSKIERKITKEPVYRKTPKYCLVVFGAEAKTRIWLVVDGDTLYADLNGNGDLTEKAEKLKEGKDLNGHSWQIGDIIEGKKKFKHTKFTVYNFNDYEFRIDVEAAYEEIPNLYGFAQVWFIRESRVLFWFSAIKPVGETSRTQGTFTGSSSLFRPKSPCFPGAAKLFP